MTDTELKNRVNRALNAQLSSLRTTPSQRARLLESVTEERKMKKHKYSTALILALALSLLTVAGALAAVLLSGQEIVEQVAVPMAQQSRQENYTYEELKELIAALNENGITLDEGSTLMQAFRSGHGYWEQDTIREICLAAFGGHSEAEWSIEQKHWYGEMMVSIGAWNQNIYLLPGENDMTVEEARALAAKILKDTYGVDLPQESNDAWRISEIFDRVCNYDENGQESWQDQWAFWYENRRTYNTDYEVTFERDGSHPEPWRASYLEKINTKNWSTVMDDLENLEGTCTQWSVETWAEFGQLIQGTDPGGRNGTLYQQAGYRLPPKGAISPEEALEIARTETGVSGFVQDHVICCTNQGTPIYKVHQRVFFDGEQKGGKYDAVWCLEIDCMTGKVLEKREYTYGPDSDFMMMYVPFSLLDQTPMQKETAADEPDEKEAAIFAQYEMEQKAIDQYGENMYFWPAEVQVQVYGGSCAIPARQEYDRALEIAKDAIADRYGSDALDALGDYQVGLMHRRWDDLDKNARVQLDWDFMLTTDPVYLSDGYRVQFTQLLYADGAEEIRDLVVEHANMGNG